MRISRLNQNLIISFIITIIFFYCVMVYASGFTNRDAYEERIRLQIQAIDERIDAGTATKRDIAVHDYYVERLETFEEAKKHKHKIEINIKK